MDSRGGRQWSPVLIPVVVAALFAVFGHPVRAGTVLVLALVAGLLIFFGFPLAQWVERGAKALGHGLSMVAGGLVFLVVIGPAWTWTRITRRDPFARTSHRAGWDEHSTATAVNASLGSATPISVGRRGLVSRFTWAVGCIVLLLSANYALGWAWDEVTTDSGGGSTDRLYDTEGTTKTSAPEAAGEGTTTTLAPVPVSATKYDPRADLPAMERYPWRYQYFQDIQRGPVSYWPYAQYRPEVFRSPYVNIDGWARRSYRTPGPSADRPTVWMFGGSTAWGEGQRDEYTIASYLARFAEADGIPIEIDNYGHRGWVHFQDMVLYEQLLALDGPPDLALFYDGVNELNTQALVPEAVPSHYDVTQGLEAMDGKTIATRFADGPDLTSLLDDFTYAYSEHSLIHKIARSFSSPAGAQEQDSGDQGAGDGTGEEDDDVVRGSQFDVTEQDGIDAGKVYMRSQKLTESLSERYDVPTLYFWQPFKFLGQTESGARAQIEDPVIDISELLLSRQDVYIDGAHTNEEGSRIVAERIWEDLEPQVRTWYEENG